MQVPWLPAGHCADLAGGASGVAPGASSQSLGPRGSPPPLETEAPAGKPVNGGPLEPQGEVMTPVPCNLTQFIIAGLTGME